MDGVPPSGGGSDTGSLTLWRPRPESAAEQLLQTPPRGAATSKPEPSFWKALAPFYGSWAVATAHRPPGVPWRRLSVPLPPTPRERLCAFCPDSSVISRVSSKWNRSLCGLPVWLLSLSITWSFTHYTHGFIFWETF